MKSEVSLGSSPANESCAQVGEEGYDARAREECARYIELVRKKMGPEPEGARLAKKWCPHDFNGGYWDVVCYYEDGNDTAATYAFACEANSPESWSDDTPVNWMDEVGPDAQKEAA